VACHAIADWARRRRCRTRAEGLLSRAVAVSAKTLGKEHPAYAETLADLGVVCTDRGQFERAEPALAEALAIRERTLGKTDPAYADSLEELAYLYLHEGHNARAVELETRALEIVEKALGKEDPFADHLRRNLGEFCFLAGRFDRAEALFEQVVQGPQKTAQPGQPNHPVHVMTLHNRAALYAETGRCAEAADCLQQALDICHRNIDLTCALQSERQQLAMSHLL